MTKQNVSDSREGSGNRSSRVEEVNEIMLAEFERSYSAATHFKDPDAETTEVVELIAEAILDRLDLAHNLALIDEDIYPLDEMINIIRKVQLDLPSAIRLFETVRFRIELDASRNRDNRDYPLNDIDSQRFLDTEDNREYPFDAIDSQRFLDTAVSYLKEKLKEEYEDLDVTEIIGRTEKQLNAMDSHDGYLFHALTAVKQDAEKELELMEKDIERKSRLATTREALNSAEKVESAGKEKVGDREKRQKDAGLTGDVVAIFFYYLFKGREPKVINAKQADLIEMLTGYSRKQTVKFYNKFEAALAEIEEETDLNEKYVKDMKDVRKRFHNMGLTDICDLIDRDLGEKT